MDFECLTLANGLRVVLMPCEAQSVVFGLFVASGSRHEPKALSGISHFIEHMLFKGTRTRSQLDITRAIEGRGGTFNAMTGEEATAFYAHVPSECLAEAVDILSDMYLNAAIPDADFERERSVIIEEIKMYEDDPSSVVLENLQRALFPSSGLGRAISGTPQTLLKMTPKVLRDYKASHYSSAATVAVLVGAFDREKAVAELTRRFPARAWGQNGALSAGRERKPVTPETVVRKGVQQAQWALGFRTFGVRDARRYHVAVLNGVLGHGMMSRLFQEVREKRGLSYDISSAPHFFREAGYFQIAAGIDEKRGGEMGKVVDRELARLCERRVSAAELKRTKEFLVGNMRLSYEKMTTRLFACGAAMLSFGRYAGLDEEVRNVREVSAEDVRDVAREIFQPQNRALSLVLP